MHRGAPVVIDGIGFSAIGRLKFLQLLRGQLEAAGVSIEFEKPLGEKRDFEGYDLVVAADGANSTVRRSADFGTTVAPLTNKFAWFGTTRVFDTLTQTFVQNDAGCFNAHHYRHSPSMSTFVFECDAATWARAGFERMDEAATLAYCEKVFADALQGHRLVSNKSIWRNFPRVRNRRWVSGNKVLIGDAQRTAHFSIGSGTRLAMEDAIALAKALVGIQERNPRGAGGVRGARGGRSSRNWSPPRTRAPTGTSISPSTCASRRGSSPGATSRGAAASTRRNCARSRRSSLLASLRLLPRANLNRASRQDWPASRAPRAG